MALNFYSLLPHYGVPARIVQSLERYYDLPDPYPSAHVPDVVAELEKKEWLFLYGPTGAGKSTLAAYAFAAYLRAHGRVIGADEAIAKVNRDSQFHDPSYRPYGARDGAPYYVYARVGDLLSSMKNDFSKPGSNAGHALYRRCCEAKCLVLDDLTDQPSAWELGQLDTLIDIRYGDMTRTIITSNHSIETLAGVVSERIARRIGEASQKYLMREVR